MQDFEFVEQLESAKLFHTRLADHFLREKITVKAEISKVQEVVAKEKFKELLYEEISLGEQWGKAWDNAVFRFTFTVPESWDGKMAAMQINVGGELLLFSEDLRELAGLTDASCFVKYDKTLYRITSPVKGGQQMCFYCDAASYNYYGVGLEKFLESGNQKPTYNTHVTMLDAGIFDENVWRLVNDFKILISLAESVYSPTSAYPGVLIVRYLDEAQAIYGENPDNAAAALAHLQKFFDLHGSLPISAAACGHGHIDIGWLWRVKESIRKAARTFSNQLDLMERYPEYIFGASQPQLYAFIKEHYPEIYARVKERVKEGRWELQGGMWVEADTNISSPESLIRQFVHGKNFFMDEFGIEVKSLWLPDVFGYSPTLPQIINLAGCDSFLTQKISWSKVNVFPYHTFYWQGIDGSRILTHFPPENTYTSSLLPHSLRAAVHRFKENDFIDEFLVLYGIGDGGGGPTDSFVEHGIRAADLLAVPRIKFGRSDEFFDRLHRKKYDLPMWNGELYLENHRGTLTTQAHTKKFNRQLEYTLLDTEMISTMADASQYPSKALDRLWKGTLLRQFHDILPGSSIKEVYEDCTAESLAALQECQQLKENAAKSLLQPDENSAVCFNPLSFKAEMMVDLPENWTGALLDGKPLEIHEFGGRKQVRLAFDAFSSLEIRRASAVPTESFPDDLTLDNGLLRAEFAESGELLRMYDYRQKRYVVSNGNRFMVYNDHPNAEDAWNINHNYMTKLLFRLTGRAVRVDRERIAVEYSFGNSFLRQEIRLTGEAEELEFSNHISWHENHWMLRMESTVPDVFAGEAEFDLQYGFLKRPVCSNTLWDMAKFECAMHRYAALRDNCGTVALLNDCKYGVRVHDNIIDLAVLRSTKFPDSSADMGEHTFRYAFYSGAPETVLSRPASVFNRQVQVFAGFSGSLSLPVDLESENVELTVFKRAEKDIHTFIVRLVECAGKFSEAKMYFDGKAKYSQCDILEWRDNGISGEDSSVVLQFKPFEIKTFKITDVTEAY